MPAHQAGSKSLSSVKEKDSLPTGREDLVANRYKRTRRRILTSSTGSRILRKRNATRKT